MRFRPGLTRRRSAQALLSTLLSIALMIPLSSLALAGELTLIWKPPVEGRLKPDVGVSIARNAFVPMDQADVVMQDKLLVATNGARILRVNQDFGTLRKVPTDGYSDEANIALPDGVYVIRNRAGQYAKLCLCGTAFMGIGGPTYTEIGATLAVAASTSAPAGPEPDNPAAQAGVLKAVGQGGKAVLTWEAFATPNQGYYVFKASTPGGYGPPLRDFPAPETTFTDTAVEAGKTYYYVVKAYREGQYAAATNEVAVTVTAADAAGSGRVVRLQVDNPAAEVDGRTVPLDVPPQLIANRTMVPLRFVAEALGAAVKWDGGEKKITLTTANRTVVLFVDRQTALIDGVDTTLDVPPTIVGNRTLVPLRFVGENLGATLVWNPADRSIELTSGGGGSTPLPQPEPQPQPEPKPPVPPQGAAGEWRCMSYSGAFCPVGWHLTLNADGTYKMGAEKGTYTLGNGTIKLNGGFPGTWSAGEFYEGGAKLSFTIELSGWSVYVVFAKE